MTLNLESLFSLLDSNPSGQDCIDYLEKVIWKEKPPTSPFVSNSKEVYKCKGNKYKCKITGKVFTAKSLTIFRSSNLSLKKWFLILSLFVSRKKGISSCQLAREVRISQKTAWLALSKLRKTFTNPIFKTKLEGIVEIDENFIGGENGNRHWNKKVPNCQGRSWIDKTPVLGMIEKNGIIITQVVPNTQQNTLEPIIRASVKEGSIIYTDEWLAYQDLGKWFNHQIVNHRIKQYVNGKATTNRIENPWSHLKRTIYGTYHWVSKKHLPKYVDEFTFRFNTRKYEEQERFDLALSATVGKSLSYRELIN